MGKQGSSDLLLPPPLLQEPVPLEKVVLLKWSSGMFLLLWAGLASPAHLDGSPTLPLAPGPRRDPDLQQGGGSFEPDPLGFNLVQRKKCPSWILPLD